MPSFRSKASRPFTTSGLQATDGNRASASKRRVFWSPKGVYVICSTH
jgi:hypothetical protein